MADQPIRSIKSRAGIAGHPLHPTVVHFPIACLLLVVISDAAFLYTDDPFWARCSLWLAGIGALAGWLASTLGLVDLISLKRVRYLIQGWCHAILAVMMLSLASLNWLWRYLDTFPLLPWAMALSLLTAALVGLTGVLGGMLVYDHAVGVDIEDKIRAAIDDD
ncbi:DUF2231 domain-containing protein [Billgrantia diversa]|uniref:DUF2231 domain-containing protein n=1 Tax=Halomonas sp. MCCC 1A13316 TaxID=2733487 RepID=UPI0018A59EAE|nr:DUF2231 domain-containing protein [Halomonas sp. MCCC 1A13316]QOR37842.1 DUF2231 domain-containing protein [Halomonas sp. MCCC 1A13316]